MKKKSIRNLLILFLVAIFISIGNVEAKAFEVGQKFTKSWHHGLTNYVDSRGNNKIRFDGLKISNGPTLTVIPYQLTGNGDTLLAYCIDPHLQSASQYKIDYILGASDDEKNNAIGLGVLEILKKGYSELPDMSETTLQTDLSKEEFYVATSIAIRAFAMGVGGQGKGASSDKELIAIASAHVTAGLDWLNKSEYKGQLSALSVSNSWYNKDYKFVLESDIANKIMSVAESLFNIGIEAATGESSTPTITSKVSQTDTEVTVTLDYKNFTPGQGEIKNFQLKCDNCAKNNITIGSLNVEGVSNGKLDSAEGTIKLTFSVTKDEENCKSASFSITYDYNDPNLQFVGAHLIPTSQTNSQNFYVLQKNDDKGLQGEVKGTIKCNNACKTELATPVCADTEANAKIDGPSKIKSCIIDNVDDAGNTYQFTSSAGGVDNSYCKIFCKEDYAEIKLNPIEKDVKCGGYFQLKSFIRGKKTCYTGGDTDENAKNGEKSIDKDKYLSDIKTVQENLVDAMNRYYEFKAKSEHKKKEDSNPFTCGGSTCDTKHKITASWESYNKVTFNWNEAQENATHKYGTVPAGSDSWTDSCNCESREDCSGTGEDRKCPTVSICGSCDTSAQSGYDAWVGNVKTQLEKAKNDLTTYMAQYKQIIQDYNACTTAWSNEFAFKQQLKYYYDENRGKDGENYTPYYDLIAGDDSLQYLEKDEKEEMKTTIKICTGKATEEYECSGDSLQDKDGSIDKSSRDEYNYNGSYGSDVFYNKDYVICSVANGCVKDTRQISQASFIKKEVEKAQKYITPTAFYQIAANGKITTVGSGYTGNKIQLEELKNALPVSTSTDGGGVFRLMIQDLGEFYDETEAVGRLIDFDGDREQNSVAYNIGSGTFDGNYKCYYESPCRPKDCPNCEFTCTGDNCSWSECTGDKCDNTCLGCVINLDDLNIIHKTISTSNFNSAGRDFGYNWITTSNLDALKIVSAKAEKTIEEIEDANETIYDNDKTTDGKGLAFSIKMTPEVVNTIKEYNKAHTKDGGYINDSLTCNDVEVNGTVYKNINCYSDFITELSNKYSDKIVAPNRGNDSEYWTTWQGYVYNEDVIGGPSWR